MYNGTLKILLLLLLLLFVLQVALQPGKLPVTTKSNLVMVTGPADRLLLTKEILDFCGAFPIYNTELSPSNSAGNGTESKLTNRKAQSATPLFLFRCKGLSVLFYFILYFILLHSILFGDN